MTSCPLGVRTKLQVISDLLTPLLNRVLIVVCIATSSIILTSLANGVHVLSITSWVSSYIYWGGEFSPPLLGIFIMPLTGRLEYAAQRQLFAVVTGDCGVGKTTIIRCFKNSLDEAQFLVMYLADSKLTPRHFYKGLLEQLGCEAKFYRGDAKRCIVRLSSCAAFSTCIRSLL